MNKITKIRFGPLKRSKFVKLFRLAYENGFKKSYEMVQVLDSVAVLIYNIERDVLVFVKQFRPGLFGGRLREHLFRFNINTGKYPVKRGITLELCAGICDKDVPLEQIASEEVMEETGYSVAPEKLEKLLTYNGCTHISGNMIHLFYCEVTDAMKTGKGGGIDTENLEIVEMTPQQYANYICVQDFPTNACFLCTYYWFFLNKYGKTRKIIT